MSEDISALVARMKEGAVRYHEASITQIDFTEYNHARLDFEAIATPVAVLALISAYDEMKRERDEARRHTKIAEAVILEESALADKRRDELRELHALKQDRLVGAGADGELRMMADRNELREQLTKLYAERTRWIEQCNDLTAENDRLAERADCAEQSEAELVQAAKDLDRQIETLRSENNRLSERLNRYETRESTHAPDCHL